MSSRMSTFFNKATVKYGIALGVIFLYHLPYLIYWDNAPITIHDNLDSTFAWVKVLLDSGMLFSSPNEPVLQVLNGLPKFAFYGSYDLGLLWFALFGMYGGLVVNKIVMSVVGFFGMFLLLKKHLLPENTPELIPWGTAVLFSILPFWSFTLSVSGIPLACYAFMEIRQGERSAVNWVILFLFAFYSSLILSGLFLLLVLAFILVYDLIRQRKINFRFLYAIIFLGLMYAISHFPLVYSFFFKGDFVSHRTAFDLKTRTLSESLEQLDAIFRFGQYHAHSLHTYLLIPIVGVLIFLIIKRQPLKRYLLLFLFIVITSLLYAVLRWELAASFFNKIAQILPIQLQRFHFLHPMAWYILLALALSVIVRWQRLGKVLIIAILGFQFLFIVDKHEIRTESGQPSFKQFFAESLFQEVREFIPEAAEDYRVISVGIHPSISHYNGFYTLDGYFPNYPLEYKNDFRRIIAKELAKDTYLTYYFDHWGSRCYAFNQTLRRDHLNPTPRKIRNLEYDYKALAEMGGKYLLSSAEVDPENNREVKLLKVFEHPDSYWTIYLYENKEYQK
ncbi:DUF6044 family protein [Poritiphilus flavus]|uniref:Glycosyltransferase RgtA/B/C/D-like domain-containing protein n=1 Tax=Poritiphilus flavus TaxID=2697053 RepID=A0A6L9EDT2_9FLAO|nr:DUF6044 family protein [Poritiphilus flavus]NAS12860.1 hypothetical protein [Poritiphilus flavus]